MCESNVRVASPVGAFASSRPSICRYTRIALPSWPLFAPVHTWCTHGVSINYNIYICWGILVLWATSLWPHGMVQVGHGLMASWHGSSRTWPHGLRVSWRHVVLTLFDHDHGVLTSFDHDHDHAVLTLFYQDLDQTGLGSNRTWIKQDLDHRTWITGLGSQDLDHRTWFKRDVGPHVCLFFFAPRCSRPFPPGNGRTPQARSLGVGSGHTSGV